MSLLTHSTCCRKEQPATASGYGPNIEAKGEGLVPCPGESEVVADKDLGSSEKSRGDNEGTKQEERKLGNALDLSASVVVYVNVDSMETIISHKLGEGVLSRSSAQREAAILSAAGRGARMKMHYKTFDAPPENIDTEGRIEPKVATVLHATSGTVSPQHALHRVIQLHDLRPPP